MTLAPVHKSMAVWGVVVWLLPLLAVAVMVGVDSTDRTVTTLYHDASASWWLREGLYSTPWGLNYFPHFAVVFSPFHWLPVPVGDIVWRVVSVGWLAWGMWQMLVLCDRDGAGRLFFWASLLAVPMCLPAIRNGQASTLLVAASLQAVVFMVRRRWWPAAIFLVGTLAIKPLGLVLLLLAPAVYRPLMTRVPAALAGLVAFPFLFAGPGYVLAQFRAVAENLGEGATMMDDYERRFANLSGVIEVTGVEISSSVFLGLSLVVAVGFLGLWLWGSRRTEGADRGVLLLFLATTYLMLFNPMNESNSYVILAPATAVLAMRLLADDRRRPAGWCLVAVLLTIGLLPEPLRRIAPDLAIWWKPLATLVALTVVIASMIDVRGRASRPAPAAPSTGES